MDGATLTRMRSWKLLLRERQHELDVMRFEIEMDGDVDMEFKSRRRDDVDMDFEVEMDEDVDMGTA
jgi:hypothetical protein